MPALLLSVPLDLTSSAYRRTPERGVELPRTGPGAAGGSRRLRGQEDDHHHHGLHELASEPVFVAAPRTGGKNEERYRNTGFWTWY